MHETMIECVDLGGSIQMILFFPGRMLPLTEFACRDGELQWIDNRHARVRGTRPSALVAFAGEPCYHVGFLRCKLASQACKTLP